MDKKISIIVPVYNCELFISRCLDSLINQDYKNLEIIVVNDGSLDNTKKIIEEYQISDDRVIVINKENSGVSDSRNVGVNRASGDYITFIDADDYLEDNIYTKIMKYIVDSDSDIGMFSYYEINNNNKKKVLFPWEDKIKYFEKNEIAKNFLPHMISKLKAENNSIMGAVWRAIIKSDIAKQHSFIEDIPIAEDMLYLIDCLMDCSKIVAINECLYNYIRHDNSATTKYKPDFDKTNQKVHTELIKRLNEIGMTEEIKKRYGLNRFVMYTLTFSNIMRNKENSIIVKYQILKEKAKICNYDPYITKDIINEMDSGRKKIYLLLTKHHYFIVACLFYFKSIIKKY